MGRPCDCTKNILCYFCHEWTDEPPTEPGWYWIVYRTASDHHWYKQIERFLIDDDKSIVDSNYDSWEYYKRYEAKRSLEPLRVPEFEQE